MSQAEPKPEKQDGASARMAAWATLGIVVILGLAVFIGSVVVPLRQTHEVVRDWDWGEKGMTAEEAIERLGGPGSAGDRLATYLHLPRWLKPERRKAAHLLSLCGPQAARGLIRALANEDPYVRWTAAQALGRIGPAADRAVPALERALKDPHKTVRDDAAWALYFIRGDVADAPEGGKIVE